MSDLRRALLLGAAVVLAALAVAPVSAFAGGSQGTLSTWVELGPRKASIARAITDAEDCPEIAVDGDRRTMRERAAPDPPDYPVTTCEHELPRNAERAKIGTSRLPLPVRDPQRIAVVGDTGCRLRTGSPFQACNDPSEWPFKGVAASIARWDPDLVIHVGDYHYRESPCPEGNAGCAGSPFGYNWAAWQADFFQPARRALRAAPWLFIRGNHESCSRAGEGWFLFLEPRPLPPECSDLTPMWIMRTPSLEVGVMDTSFAADTPPFNPGPYQPAFTRLAFFRNRPAAWLLTHRPLWALASVNGQFVNTNETLQQASGNALPGRFELVLSGHLHQHEVTAFGPDRPVQVVAGQGGTALDPQIPPAPAGTQVGGAPLRSGQFSWEFGFDTFVERRGDWSFRIRDVAGRSLESCRIDPSSPC